MAEGEVFRLRRPDEMLGYLLNGIANRIGENVSGARRDDEATLRALRENLSSTLGYVDEWLDGPPVQGVKFTIGRGLKL